MWMCWYSRYYYWYPIDYSPAPLYCYLFKQVSYLISMKKLFQVLLLRYFQHCLLFLHSVPMRTMSRWLRLWSEVDIQATTSLTATTSTTLSPGWLLVLIFVTRLVSCISFCHIPFCRTDVCPVKISPPGVVVRRAGATARWRMFNSNDEYRCLSYNQGQLTGESQRIKFKCI